MHAAARVRSCRDGRSSIKGGRADVRFSIDANGELFLYSKGDGVIRAVVEAIGF